VPEQTLAHYRIESELGAGGMGVVYQATDTRLGRRVAIKLLHEAGLKDPDRLARFDREARMLATLNHANIAAIHGLEESGGVKFLVLEYVPGDTLAQRLAKAPLPLKEALDLGRQVADALGAAHEAGVIHRDLKPANIKITPEGKVKVLDFGLAKALEVAQASACEETKTIAADMTHPGMVMGTAPYMSPEQAKGKPVDRRTDIWAFGCVMYEALTGKRTFPGDSTTEILVGILDREPEWDALPVGTPENVKSLLRRCLTKDPRSQRPRGGWSVSPSTCRRVRGSPPRGVHPISPFRATRSRWCTRSTSRRPTCRKSAGSTNSTASRCPARNVWGTLSIHPTTAGC
jgi:serine/threonine-protein kinase